MGFLFLRFNSAVLFENRIVSQMTKVGGVR